MIETPKQPQLIGEHQSGTTSTGPRMTRRQLLAGTGKAALLAMAPLGCVQVANNPFSDGTFWDDGLGWSA